MRGDQDDGSRVIEDGMVVKCSEGDAGLFW